MLKLPDGFHTVTSYIVCDDPLKLAQFMIAAFDAKELGRTALDNGRIANLQIMVGDTALMLSQSDNRYNATANAAYYIYLENADSTMQKALEAGAELEMEVSNMPYQDRQGGVRDPFDNIWWISQRLTENPYH